MPFHRKKNQMTTAKSLLSYIPILLFYSGCAFSYPVAVSDKQTVFAIECNGVRNYCKEKARELCPQGYVMTPSAKQFSAAIQTMNEKENIAGEPAMNHSPPDMFVVCKR